MPVAYYRLYYIEHGRFSRALSIPAEDDEQAVAQASEKVGGDVGELWLGDRKVMAFNPVAG